MNPNTDRVIGLAVLFMVLSFVFEEHFLVAVSIVLLFGILLRSSYIFALGKMWSDVFSLIVTLVSNTLLIFIFYFFIFPYSLLYRLLHGREVNEYKNGPNKQSSYFTIDVSEDRESFKNPW